MNEFREAAAGVPGSLAEFVWGAPGTFLGLPPEHTDFEEAGVVLLPVPYEATVSWMSGTKHGPGAIMTASHYVELYDHQLDREPYTIGIHTLPELLLTHEGPEQALNELRRVMDVLVATGKLVVMVGGEHSLSSSPILAHADHLGGKRLSVLQLDAHTDLRTEYGGTPFSHACVMQRVHQRVDLVPVGIRSLTREERSLMREKNIPVIFAHELDTDGWIDRTLDALGPEVYITFDVDFLDPSVMPATGTPEPGGGSWNPTVRLLERVFRERHVVGCDVVELAPIPGMVSPDFLAAKLIYKMMGFHAAQA
ncbi:MAG: agmatinase [Gemmatimonadetes bacterium]|nr:agmatinase [Gemmatimonadota bacterium]